jgi:hypothetical protein
MDLSIYLTPASGPPYTVVTQQEGVIEMHVSDIIFDSPNYLHGKLQGGQIATEIVAETRRYGTVTFMYHPGAAFESGAAAWDFVGSTLKFLMVHSAIRDHQVKNPGRSIPPSVYLPASALGVSGASNLQKCYEHATSAHHYPHEGYYFAHGQERGVFIHGKIHHKNVYQ